jgi:sulfur relay protein TusB/DsrH
MPGAREISGCLHLITGPGGEALRQCRSQCGPDDSVVFMDAGVMHLLETDEDGFPAGDHRVHFAAADLAARGLDAVAASAAISTLTDAGIARLIADHPHCLTWK